MTFPQGSTDQSFAVNTLSDSVWEAEEVFNLNIVQPTIVGLTIGNGRTEVTITDTTGSVSTVTISC